MSKQVRETTAGQQISAWVVLNKKGVQVAGIQAFHGSTVQVDVWNIGDAASWKSYSVAAQTGRVSRATLDRTIAKAPAYYTTLEEQESWAAFELFSFQSGRAGGGGYDKFAAALGGLIIDGHTIADHCGAVPEDEKARAALMRQYCKFHDFIGERERAMEKGWDRAYWNKRAEKIGCTFANWDSTKNRYDSLHFIHGLRRLECFGYNVIQAI